MTQQWRKWEGGACPVLPEDHVQVRMRDGRTKILPAKHFIWYHDAADNANDIVEWRFWE